MDRTRLSTFAAGALIANSAPHLASAAAGRRHLTPLGGRGSGPALNAVWGGLNLAAGIGLLACSQRGTTGGWGRDLRDFESGYLAVAGWMAVTERILGTNSTAGE